MLRGELTGGGMIAAALILSRALSPVERALGAWRSYVSARAARANLAKLFRAMRAGDTSLSLPKPTGRLLIENLQFQPSDCSKPIIRKVDLSCRAGPNVRHHRAVGLGQVDAVPPVRRGLAADRRVTCGLTART